MEYRRLGDTGLYVSRIGMGTTTFGPGRDDVYKIIAGTDQATVDEMVGMAIDAGVNFFDSANSYNVGESEIALGKALKGKRKDMIVTSKVFAPVGPSMNDRGLSRRHILAAVEDSLRRLGTDYIDLYQAHNFHDDTPLEETLRAFDDLVRQGKVRYIGCSNFAAWQVMKALGVSKELKLERISSLQVYYSLAGRDIEYEIVPCAIDQKLGILSWSPLASGALSGRFARNKQAPEDARRTHFAFPPVDMEQLYDIVEVLEKIGARQNATVAQMALAWQLHKPFVTSVLIATKKPSQLEDNLGASNVKLTAEEMAEIDAVSATPPLYPTWQQESARRRLGQTVAQQGANFILKD